MSRCGRVSEVTIEHSRVKIFFGKARKRRLVRNLLWNRALIRYDLYPRLTRMTLKSQALNAELQQQTWNK